MDKRIIAIEMIFFFVHISSESSETSELEMTEEEKLLESCKNCLIFYFYESINFVVVLLSLYTRKSICKLLLTFNNVIADKKKKNCFSLVI